MRAGRWLLSLGVVLAGLAGCRTSDKITPPERPEECVAPPADDPRYSGPPQFPKGTLNQGPPRPVANPMEQPGAPGRPPSPGGPGMMSPGVPGRF
jgi:hypothetical protein